MTRTASVLDEGPARPEPPGPTATLLLPSTLAGYNGIYRCIEITRDAPVYSVAPAKYLPAGIFRRAACYAQGCLPIAKCEACRPRAVFHYVDGKFQHKVIHEPRLATEDENEIFEE